MSENHTMSESTGDGTAGALVSAAIAIFGRKGYDSTSTREIAAAAKTNVASISYHFGGKEGLRLACAKAFVAHVGALIARVADHEVTTPSEAESMLLTLVEQFARHMIGSPEMRPLASFALREISDAGPGIDVLYGDLIAPMHQRLCRLWALATGEDPASEAVQIFVFSMIGQVIYFRIGAPVVTRKLGWAGVDAAGADRIATVLKTNLADLIATRRRFSP